MLSAALVAAALICFAACAPAAPANLAPNAETEAPLSSQGTGESNLSAAAQPVQKEDQAAFQASGSGGIFDGIFKTLPESGVLEVTDQNGTMFQVDASDENVGKMWDLLLQQNYDKLEASDDLFKGDYDTISLSFSRAQDKFLIRLYGCGEDHPVYPGRTVIDLESHGDGESDFKTYAGGLAVFEGISALVDQLRGTLRVVLNQPYIKLEAGDLKGQELTAWLQMGNRLICAFTGADGNSRVMLFDTESGSLLGTGRVAEPVMRLQPSREESGYDYQMYTASRILYKDSKNPVGEKAYTPPKTGEGWDKGDGSFDLQGEKLVWSDSDGICLMSLDEEADGSEQRILGNEELTGLAGALAPKETMRAVDPRLMNSGEQVVIPVLADDKLAGIVLVDLASGEKKGYFDVFGKNFQGLAFPDKRTFAAAGEEDVSVVNVTSGDSKRLSFVKNDETEWYSGDYSTFIVSEKTEDTLFTSYLTTARKSEDRSRPFLKVEGRGTFQAVGASDRNLLAYVNDDEGPRYLLIKY